MSERYKKGTLKKAGAKAALAGPNPNLPMYRPERAEPNAEPRPSRPRPPTRLRLSPTREDNIRQEEQGRQRARRHRQTKASRERMDSLYRKNHSKAAKAIIENSAIPHTKRFRFRLAQDRGRKVHELTTKSSARPETGALKYRTTPEGEIVRNPVPTEAKRRRVARGLSRAASRAGKGIKTVAGGALGATIGAGLVAERAAAAPREQRAKEAAKGAFEVGLSSAVGAGIARAAPSLARLATPVGAAMGAAAGVYNIGRLAKTVGGIFEAKRHIDKTRAHTREKYGTVEAATRTRKERERARKNNAK